VDQVFLFTLLAIFAAALFGSYFNRRTRDRCLRDFGGFHTTVELREGKTVWGLLEVYPNGVELLYPTPHRDLDGHLETSTIFVGEQLAQVQAVCRYQDELTPPRQELRRREIERASHPSSARRLGRHLRNFLNTFRDAFQQSLGFSLTRLKASTAILQNDAHFAQLGQSVLSIAHSAYEPVLERYLNRRVVVEEKRGDAWVERAGILKAYTAHWIELLDVRVAQEQRLDLTHPERLRLLRDLDFVVRIERSAESKTGILLELRISNLGSGAVRLLSLEGQGYAHRLDVAVSPGATLDLRFHDLPPELLSGIELEQLPRELRLLRESVEDDEEPAAPLQLDGLPAVELVLQGKREVDLCLPRSYALLRHGGG
jgi:hypothetical protein